MMNNPPAITFGIIVLNGEPFMRYNLRALYPFAHQIIVVEGAAPAAAGIATPDGHSRDSTLATIRRFQQEEDPANKVILVTAEDEGYPDGFWPGEKDEQSRAYARRATGDFLWQVDSDEFYRPEDMTAVITMLQQNRDITAVTFPTITFWGSFDYLVDGWYLQRGAKNFHRLFRWGAGYRYTTHRPPTVHTADGADTRSLTWVSPDEMASRGIFMHHYSLLFPKQVIEKCDYYGTAAWARRRKAQRWAQHCYLQLRCPYRVHNVYHFLSWLERFSGAHPPQIEALQTDIAAGRLDVACRRVDDIERLLNSPLYQGGKRIVRAVEPIDRLLRAISLPLRRFIFRLRTQLQTMMK